MTAFLAGGIVVGTVLLYASTSAYLWQVWTAGMTGEYAHGPLVVGIAAYLLFTKRHQLRQVAARPSYAGILLLFLASTLWFLGYAVDVQIVQSLALVATLQAATLAVFGARYAKATLLPALVLLTAIPAWYPLLPLMQSAAAFVAGNVVEVLGVPVLRQGFNLHIPAGTFEVAETCSGLRYLLAAIATGVLFSSINYRTLSRQLAFVASLVALGIVANWIRIVVVIYVGQVSDMQHPLVHDHITLGWTIFTILMFAHVYLAGRYFADVAPDPETMTSVSRPQPPALSLFPVALAVVALGTGPAAAAWFTSADGKPIHNSKLALPVSLTGCAGPGPMDDDWHPVFRGASVETLGRYSCDKGNVFVYIAFYAQQRQGQELINIENTIDDGSIWSRAWSESRAFSAVSGSPVLENRLRGHSRERLVWHWYRIGSTSTNNPFFAKLLQFKSLLSGHGKKGALIAIAADLDGDPGKTRKLLEQFKMRVAPDIESTVDRL